MDSVDIFLTEMYPFTPIDWLLVHKSRENYETKMVTFLQRIGRRQATEVSS